MTFEMDRRSALQMLALGVGSTALVGDLTQAFAAGDTATIGWPSDVPSWDPNQRFTPDAQPIFKLVFDQPIDQDPKLTLIPKLLTKWDLAPDGMSMAVELRNDVKFHNGDQMTAEDFRYTFFERIKAGHKVDTANSWRKVTDIEVQSPTKAVMKFNSPAPTAPQWLAFLGSFIVSKKYLEYVGVEAAAQKPVGTGPYKLVDYQLNSRIVLERNDDYWGPKAKIKRVTFEIIKDPSARVAAMQSGQVDLTINVPVREVERLGKEAVARPPKSIRSRASSCCNAQRSRLRRRERAACGASRDRQGGALEGLLRRRRGAALGGGDAGHGRLPRPTSSSTTTPSSRRNCWRSPGFSPAKPAQIKFAATNGHFPSDFDIARAIAADVEEGRHRRRDRDDRIREIFRTQSRRQAAGGDAL